MIGQILKLELTNWLRNRRIFLLIFLLALSLAGSAIWGTRADIDRQRGHHDAGKAARAQWEGKGAANPHGMAHFGDFVFRPTGPLARLDRGVQARLGKVLRVEGHRQGTPLHSDAARAGTLARFSPPDAAFLIQIVTPLLLIFLGSTGLAADRETGRLRLLLTQGTGAGSILAGHFFALWGLGIALLFIVMISSVATSAAFGSATDMLNARLIGFFVMHAAYLAVVTAGVVAATVWLRSARTALFSLLAVWILGTVVVPRTTSALAGSIYALPSQDAFQAAMRDAREAGPDGHNPEDAHLEQLRQKMLAEHDVETVEELPLNFDGIAMQVDEEFGNQVWDQHYGNLRNLLKRQGNLASRIALINPYQAIDHVSMAIAGTDLMHDFSFQQQVEAYRRKMVEALNHEHAYGGSKTGDWSWEASAEFYAGMKPFNYEPLGMKEVARARASEFLTLCAWLPLLLVALIRCSHRLERRAI